MNSIARIISRMLAVSLLVFVAACSDRDSVLYEDDLPTAAPETPAAEEPEGPGSIVEVATEAGSFPTLLAAVDAAGLASALSDESASLTVFAPTEEAFAALPEGTLDALLADPDTLAGILTYHVLGSAVTVSAAADLAGTTVETLNGGDVALTARGADLYVNNAKIVTYDIEASNGVIHVIDTVLLPVDLTPSTSTIAEIAVADENFETLVAAATAADLVGTLGDPDASLTLFAPTDAAFEAMGAAAVQYLLDNPDKLESTLLYHVAGAQLTSIDATAAMGSSITMANGDDAAISLGESGLMINGSNIVTTDIVAANGIIHVIDAVLQAPSVGPAPLGIVAASSGSFTTLTAAVDAAGLGDALMDPNANLTVFAPTDDAFDALPAGQLDALLEDTEALTNLLQYHLYADTVSSADAIALAGNEIVMANEDSASVSTDEDGNLFINDAQVILADVAASNGVIHAIDKVLIPSGSNLAVADLSGTFGGATVEDDVYEFPTGAADWAGFANNNVQMYPLSFPYGGKITFTASIPEGSTDTNVRFRFERLPFPDVEPSYNTETVLVTTSGGERTYSIDIPGQGANTFESFLLYVVDRDQPVMIKDVTVEEYAAEEFADFGGTFGGTTVEDDVYEFPTGAADWGGFANDNTALYPMSFPQGGRITFTAGIPEGGTDTQIRYRFERLPFPDVEPSYNTGSVTISGAEATYSIEVPSQGENTFESFLLFVVERDSPVIVKNVRVTAYETEDLADFGGTFGGTTVEDDVYEFPTGAADWGGFANDNTALYPMSFPNGGYVAFNGAIPEGGADTAVRFRFERLPFPDVEPSYNTEAVVVSGTADVYRIEIPAQPAANTFSSFLFYINDRDSPVIMKNARVVAY